MTRLTLLAAVVVLGGCHHEPPEVERFLGNWGPKAGHMQFTYELKPGGRYVLHGDTGNTTGSWTLVESTDDTTTFETHVGDAVDHIQLKIEDGDHVWWTSLNTNDAQIFERR